LRPEPNFLDVFFLIVALAAEAGCLAEQVDHSVRMTDPQSKSSVSGIAYFYSLRVPILTFVFVVLICPFASSHAGRSLFHNLLILDWWGIFWVAVLVSLNAYAIIHTGRVIVRYGPQRGLGNPPKWMLPAKEPDWVRIAIDIVLLLSFLAYILLDQYKSSQGSISSFLPTIAAWIAGLFVCQICMSVGLLVGGWVAGSIWWKHTAPVGPKRNTRVSRRTKHSGEKRGPGVDMPPGRLPFFPARFGPGYLESGPEGWNRLKVGHGLMAGFALSSFVAFWIVGHVRETQLLSDQSSPATVPALAYLLLASLFACFALSGLTFFLDRYRIPLLFLALIFSLISVRITRSDHFFRVYAPDTSIAPSPAETIAGRDRIILVAAAGGGIQAAGWTAKVLTSLANENPGFKSSVRLVSSVSGGSVGALYFLKTYGDENHAAWDAQKAFNASVQPSLGDIAWALVYKDLPNAILPWARGDLFMDRGWALERVLAKRADVNQIKLSDWSRRVKEGFPAVLLNSTEAETGRPIVFSNTAFPSEDKGIDNFSGLYHKDIEIATAVRLSASFPFVAPAARPLLDSSDVPSYHLVDGGYYDGFGTVSLLPWIREALQGSHSSPPRILVIRIVAFPDDVPPQPTLRGWFYQIWAPVDAMLSVRGAGQNLRDEEEFRLVQHEIGFESVTFSFKQADHCSAPSLSWDLTKNEIDCLEQAWKKQQCRDKVRDFLNGRDTTRPDCEL
jgi:predicted acylesterase/phospholipase RssA